MLLLSCFGMKVIHVYIHVNRFMLPDQLLFCTKEIIHILLGLIDDPVHMIMYRCEQIHVTWQVIILHQENYI